MHVHQLCLSAICVNYLLQIKHGDLKLIHTTRQLTVVFTCILQDLYLLLAPVQKLPPFRGLNCKKIPSNMEAALC